MKPRRISTDRDGARALRRLMRPDASPQRLRPVTIPKQSGVTVEIVSDIAAGDYSKHQAKLLTMQGGQLQETGNTVPVRHVGEGKVTAGTKVIVEPCGRLGLCFARTDGGQPEVNISLQRLTEAVGPQSNYFGDEDLSWTYQPAGTYPYNSFLDHYLPTWTRSGHWKADGPFGEPWDSIYDPLTVPNSRVPWTATWNRKLQPFRWQITSGQDGGMGHRGFNWSWRYSEHWWGQLGRFNWLVYPGSDYGPSGTTLGPNSHLWPMTLDSLDLSLYGHWCFKIHGFQSYRTFYGCEMECRAYRVWIDGVDVTGVVSGPFSIGQPATGQNRRGSFTAGTHVEAAITAAQHQSKPIEFDIWLNATFTLQSEFRDINDNPVTTSWTDKPMMFSAQFGAGGFTRLKSANIYQQINQGKVWDFTFNGVTVGGLSSIQNTDNEPTWYWTGSTGSERWGFDTSADEVYFRWGGEIPLIIVLVDAAAFPADDWVWGGEFVYAPADSGDYTGHDLWLGFNYTPGVWNVDAATTFVPIGGIGYAPDHIWLDPQLGVGYRDQLPSSITVEPA